MPRARTAFEVSAALVEARTGLPPSASLAQQRGRAVGRPWQRTSPSRRCAACARDEPASRSLSEKSRGRRARRGPARQRNDDSISERPAQRARSANGRPAGPQWCSHVSRPPAKHIVSDHVAHGARRSKTSSESDAGSKCWNHYDQQPRSSPVDVLGTSQFRRKKRADCSGAPRAIGGAQCASGTRSMLIAAS